MKKWIYALIGALFVVISTSCKEDDITKQMCKKYEGEWILFAPEYEKFIAPMSINLKVSKNGDLLWTKEKSNSYMEGKVEFVDETHATITLNSGSYSVKWDDAKELSAQGNAFIITEITEDFFYGGIYIR